VAYFIAEGVKLNAPRCPQLRTIGTSVGGRIPNHHVCSPCCGLLCNIYELTPLGQLFGFQNLLGFSLIFKPNLHQNASDRTLSVQGKYYNYILLIQPC
jgi:hypothetical protein